MISGFYSGAQIPIALPLSFTFRNLTSHLRDNRHRPFHKSLPCQTHSPFSFLLQKENKKDNETHKHQHSFFFFFFYSDLETLVLSALLRNSRIPPLGFLPTAEPEIPLPNHCSEPLARLLGPNSSFPYTRPSSSCPPCASRGNSQIPERKRQVSGSHSHRLSEH